MSDKVIEPSEIIVEDADPIKENPSHVNPWIRCVARFFDYALLFFCLIGLQRAFSISLPYGHLIPFEFVLWIPIESALLCLIGTTPGKWFLKTKLKWGRRPKPDFKMALQRSFSVWLRGLGMGIPFLNLLCPFFAYHKLKVLKVTSWDIDQMITVTHYPIHRIRLGLAVFVAIAGTLFYYSI
jgi:hypothetical protein